MIAIFLAILATMSSIDCIPQKSCHRLKIEETWYEKEAILTGIGKANNLNIHKGTNTLFFSYTVPDSYSDLDFQLAYYKIGYREYQTIAGIKGGFSVAIDEENDEIYLGGIDGIYKYNMLTKLADFYNEKGINIWSMFYKRNLFYISYPDQKLHMEIDGKFSIVKEFQDIEVDNFYINNDDDIYFANKTGFYKFDNDHLSTDVINELISVRQITEDNDGNMHLCTHIGIFKLDKNDTGFKKVLDMRNVQGLAFDNDNNIILSDEKSILKLMKTNTGCLRNDDHW